MNPRRQTVVVTGASGQLGTAVVAWFRQRDAHLVLIEHRRALQATPPHTTLVQADLLQRDKLIQALDGPLRDLGRVDVLCHLAGGFQAGSAAHETAAQDWDLMMDLNARSLMHIAAAVVPHMLAQRQGRIVAVGAMAGLKGAAGMGAYAASKSALMRLVESMSGELRDHGINVNCVLPSTLDTPGNRTAMPDADPSRWVGLDALAEVIGFLASDAARAVHGALVPVTGRV